MLQFITENLPYIIGIIFIIVIVLAIMLLFIRQPDTTSQTNTTTYISNHYTANETDILEEVKEETELEQIDDAEIDEKGLHIRYNYSFAARLHQAPKESQERFSQIKNYALSYTDVTVRESWKYERFMYKGKPVFKAWIHGNNLKLYFNLKPSELRDSKYDIEDVSYAKMHETTPSLLTVNGPRLLSYAKELIDIYMAKFDGTIETLQAVDYALPYEDKDTLIKRKLIRVKEMK